MKPKFLFITTRCPLKATNINYEGEGVVLLDRTFDIF